MGHSGAFVGHAAFFLPCISSKWLSFFFFGQLFQSKLRYVVSTKDDYLGSSWQVTIAYYQSPQIMTKRRGQLWWSLIFNAPFSKEGIDRLFKKPCFKIIFLGDFFYRWYIKLNSFYMWYSTLAILFIYFVNLHTFCELESSTMWL